VSTPSKSPVTFPPKPPLPDATKPTPMNERTAATQKLRCRRSSPTTVAMIPMKIGVVPSRSAIVEAAAWSTP